MPVNLGVSHLAPTKRKVSLKKLQKIGIVSTPDKKREHCWFWQFHLLGPSLCLSF